MSSSVTHLATYRLQLRGGFGFTDARRILPYLERLGISHVYLSPILKARSGSTHGYDVVDPTRLDPALGSEDEFRALAADVHDRGMGLVVDIVPNHMATGSENPYWTDVLTHGIASRYAEWFDIDWDARGQRVVIPILGDRLSRAIASGELALVPEIERRRFVIRYHEHDFPVDPRTIPLLLDLTVPGDADAGSDSHDLDGVLMRLRMLPTRAAAARSTKDRAAQAAVPLGQLFDLMMASDTVRHRLECAMADFKPRAARGPARLRALLGRQAYRLSYWRREAREINYRRFFTVSHLVGLRQENEMVFNATHKWIAAAVAEGLVQGVRVDHIDGLYSPSDYVRRLHALVDGIPIWVEKILSAGEELVQAWPVAGSTGYDFLNRAEELFIDSGGHTALDHMYRRFTGRRISFQETVRRSKRRILTGHLAPDVMRLARQLRGLLQQLEIGQALTAADLAAAVTETIVHFGRYRTYANPATGEIDARERTILEYAFTEATRSAHASSAALDAQATVMFDSESPARPLLRYPSPHQGGPTSPSGGVNLSPACDKIWQRTAPYLENAPKSTCLVSAH
jgi:(1->4)-alpha-D-glucan 1-alpha-D-glucosylmutase